MIFKTARPQDVIWTLLRGNRLACGVFFIALIVLASSASEAIGAESWLPHFEPLGYEGPKNLDRTRVDIRSQETKIYKFEACERVAGRVDIKEAGDGALKRFAISQEPGRTTAYSPACGTVENATETGIVDFSTGGACDTSTPGPWYFSIRCASAGSCKFWWGVDNHGKRIDCSEPEPEGCDGKACLDLPSKTIEVVFQEEDGDLARNAATGNLCKYEGQLAWRKDQDPVRYELRMPDGAVLQVCDWPE